MFRDFTVCHFAMFLNKLQQLFKIEPIVELIDDQYLWLIQYIPSAERVVQSEYLFLQGVHAAFFSKVSDLGSNLKDDRLRDSAQVSF